MPSVRHGSEWAAGAAALAALLEPLASHPRAGTRQWSVWELGILRQWSSLGPLIEAFDDGDEQVRVEADARWRCSPGQIPTPPMWWLVCRSCAEALLPRQVASVFCLARVPSAYGTLRVERRGRADVQARLVQGADVLTSPTYRA